MKRINKLLMVVTLVLLVISFMFFGISVIGGLIDSTVLILFWYLGLAELWAILMTSALPSESSFSILSASIFNLIPTD